MLQLAIRQSMGVGNGGNGAAAGQQQQQQQPVGTAGQIPESIAREEVDIWEALQVRRSKVPTLNAYV